MEERPKAPGLKWRPRKNGLDVPYWFAPKEAVDRGFLPKSVRLKADDPDLLGYCDRLQAQTLTWLAGRHGDRTFDFTFKSLLDRYLADPESSYKRLKPSSRHPYEIYAAQLILRIGEVRIDLTDGRDVQRWFKVWAGVEDLRDPAARLPRARAMLSVLKAAVSFGVICRLTGCLEFKAVLGELEFPTKKRRSFAPTAAQVEAACIAAHTAGAPSRALAYAIQYETTLRQWDVTGQWVPIADMRPSAVVAGTEKWIGPTWAMIDKSLVLRLTYGKTEDTSALTGTYDLSVCPMVVAELARLTTGHSGPLIVDERTRLPYTYDHFLEGWKADFAAAGLPALMWNRDLRAGGITEGGMAGASADDRRKVAGHTTVRQVAQVYDRETLEAHRRVATVRNAGRVKKGE